MYDFTDTIWSAIFKFNTITTTKKKNLSLHIKQYCGTKLSKVTIASYHFLQYINNQ